MSEKNRKFRPDVALALLEKVDGALSVGDPQDALNRVLALVLDAFECDRAYLQMPCHPEAESFRMPLVVARGPFVEDSKPEKIYPMDPIQREFFRLRLEGSGPLKIDISTFPAPEYDELRRLGVGPGVVRSIKATMSMAIRPPVGPIWGFGIQFCEDLHVFTDDEAQVFELIGRRVSDTLSLWVVQDRLSDVSSLEALGLMVGDTALDLATIVDRIDEGLAHSSKEETKGLRRETQLMKRLLEQIGALAKQN